MNGKLKCVWTRACGSFVQQAGRQDLCNSVKDASDDVHGTCVSLVGIRRIVKRVKQYAFALHYCIFSCSVCVPGDSLVQVGLDVGQTP